MDIHNEYIANEKELFFYKNKPILNKRHAFYDINGNPWDFTGATAFTFKIWEEREGGYLVIDWDNTNLTVSGHEIILNAPAEDTNVERGRYYYEIEYVTGGYPVLLAYGQMTCI